MPLTKNEAIERAALIWGPEAVVSPHQERATPNGFWLVDTPTEDPRGHFLDANGHTHCHEACALLEARKVARQHGTKTAAFIGSFLARRFFAGRGNHSEVHIDEATLAQLLAGAADVAREHL